MRGFCCEQLQKCVYVSTVNLCKLCLMVVFPMILLQSTTHLLTGGAEKILRIFDLGRPDAAPTIMEGSPGTPIRAAVWHHSDQTILSSSNDIGGVRYAALTPEELIAVQHHSSRMHIHLTFLQGYQS